MRIRGDCLACRNCGLVRFAASATESVSALCFRWGPSSIDGPGVGGSEEAVIFLSREFAKLGYFVEVYGLPSEVDAGQVPSDPSASRALS
jgi:hypothetical protein